MESVLEKERNDVVYYVFTSDHFMELSEQNKTKLIVSGYIFLCFQSLHFYIFPEPLLAVISSLVGSLNFVSLWSSAYCPLWKRLRNGYSIVSPILFKTISSSLKDECANTQQQESIVLLEMEDINKDMQLLRAKLDEYVLHTEGDLNDEIEENIRTAFETIQPQLLQISNRQNTIHEKLRILHSVERSLDDLQKIYKKRMEELKKIEADVLKDLHEQRIRRDRAIKIHAIESSCGNWAMAKLNYTLSIAQTIDGEDDFGKYLENGLTKLRFISENQNHIVRDYHFVVDELESRLLSVRHDMSKIKTMTDKKIYDLRKQIEIAKTLELGNRELSPASATEIARETRHYSVKIQRQLGTLKNEVEIYNYPQDESNLRANAEIKEIMTNKKLKSFFTVFIQTFNQTICDIILCYKNVNCFMVDDTENIDDEQDNKSIEYEEDVEDIKSFCMELYGIKNILKLTQNKGIKMVDKIFRCMKFIQIAVNTLKHEIHKIYSQYPFDTSTEDNNFDDSIFAVDVSEINEIIFIIGRKISVYDDKIEKTNDNEISKLAQERVKAIFETIVNTQHLNDIFEGQPLSSMQFAKCILKYIFRIDITESKDIVSHYSLM